MKHSPFSVKSKTTAIFLIVFFSLSIVVASTKEDFFYLISPKIASAAINQQINYQGKLTDSSNITVADGTYDIVFKLYTGSSGGVAIWTETRTGGNQVQVTSGLFSVMLGSVNSLSGINFNQTLYLGVTVGADAEMTPRKILGSVPASIEAYNLGGASSTQYLRADQSSTIAASTSQTLFKINQTGSGNAFDITSGATALFTVLQNGNVGIGTTTPESLLTVAGTANITGAATFGSTINVTGLSTLINASSTNFSVSGNSYLGTIKSGTWNGTTIGVLFGGTGQTTYTDGQLLIGNSTGNTLTKATLSGTSNQISVTNGSGSITLSTPQDIATASLVQFGRLGISVTPDSNIPLIVAKNSTGAATVASLINSSTAAVNNNAVLFFNDKRTTNGATDIAGIGGLITDITSNAYKGALTFGTANNSSPDEKMRLDYLGNLAIGTTSPLAKLDVFGNAGSLDLFALSSSTNSRLLTFNAAGNLGLATSTPGFLLTVAGTSNFTNALNFNGDSGTNGYVLQSKGSGTVPQWVATSTLGITGGGGVSSVSNSDGTLTISPTTGSVVASLNLGNANTWTAAQTFSNSTYSALFTGGPVGFGTSTPIAKVDIYGAAGSSDIFAISSSTNARLLTLNAAGNLGVGTAPSAKIHALSTTEQLRLGYDASNYTKFTVGSGSGLTLTPGTDGTSAFNFTKADGTTSIFNIDSTNAKVGIGTSTPTAKFDIYGLSGSSDILAISSSTNSRLLTLGPNGFLGIGTSTPGSTFSVQGTSGFAGQLFDVASSSGASYLHVRADGNVGIGTSTPTAALVIQAPSGNNDLFNIASSTGSKVLSVESNGTLVLGNFSADPTGGSNGATYYNTTTNSFRCRVNSAWQPCDTSGSKYIVQVADFAATSSNTTLGSDNDLGFAMAANSTYYVQASIDFDMTNTSADGKYSFIVPAGATINLETLAGQTAATIAFCHIISSAQNCGLVITVAFRQRIIVTGIVTTAGTAGDLRFQFAQNTSTAAAAPIVRAGSWMNITNSTNGGGADLAEIYYSLDSNITPGDVVSLDSSIDAGVAKSTIPYDHSVMGVVSTQPGMVLGLGEVAQNTDKHPVTLALVGRVPVKVNTENGPIAPGDYLTSSSMPGVAMKATKPGFVFGQAMTGFDESLDTDGDGVGLVTTFLKQTFYYTPDAELSFMKILKSTSDPNAEVIDYKNYDDALSVINGTNLYSYRYINSTSGTSTLSKYSVGFSADQANSQLLSGMSTDQTSVNGLLIGSVKALDNKVNDLNASSSKQYLSILDSITSLTSSFGLLNDSINSLKSLDASTTDALLSLDLRVSSLEGLNIAASTPSVSSTWLSVLESFGSEIVDGISYLKNVFAEHFTAQNLTIKGKDITKTGFTIYDRATSQPICVYFENGIQRTEAGECPDSTATSSIPTPIVSPIILEPLPPIIIDSTSTPTSTDQIIDPTPTPTPTLPPTSTSTPPLELSPIPVEDPVPVIITDPPPVVDPPATDNEAI